MTFQTWKSSKSYMLDFPAAHPRSICMATGLESGRINSASATSAGISLRGNGAGRYCQGMNSQILARNIDESRLGRLARPSGRFRSVIPHCSGVQSI
jgi:hypothetical protein